MSCEHHLQWPPGTSIPEGEVDQMRPCRRSHWTEVAQRETRSTANFEGQSAIRQSRVKRPRSFVGHPSPEHQIGRLLDNGFGHCGQVMGVERAVTVHETDDAIRCGHQSRPTRRAKASLRLNDHPRSQSDRTFGGTIGRPVVNHKRFVIHWHPSQNPGQGCNLVEDRKDDNRHSWTVVTNEVFRTRIRLRKA